MGGKPSKDATVLETNSSGKCVPSCCAKSLERFNSAEFSINISV